MAMLPNWQQGRAASMLTRPRRWAAHLHAPTDGLPAAEQRPSHAPTFSMGTYADQSASMPGFFAPIPQQQWAAQGEAATATRTRAGAGRASFPAQLPEHDHEDGGHQGHASSAETEGHAAAPSHEAAAAASGAGRWASEGQWDDESEQDQRSSEGGGDMHVEPRPSVA